jgi:hypothetical protein
MKLKMRSALLAVTVLASLGAGCSQPPAQAAQGAQAGADQGAAATSKADSQTATSLAGEYEGEFEGAAATASISGPAPNYNVHIIIGGDGCGGGALGPARVGAAGALTLRPSDDAQCTITMTPTANGFSVVENQCSGLHGDTCAFSGELHHAR